MKSFPNNDESVMWANNASDLVSAITGTDEATDTHHDRSWIDDDSSPPTQNIFGRSAEISQLVKAYEKLLQTKQSQIVFVHGESGSGKTALVDTIRDTVCARHQGHFVAGKYVQNAVIQEQYSAIMAAFSDLCDLTIQLEDFDEDRRKVIKENLGDGAAQLLVKVVTSLSSFIGDIESNHIQEEASFGKFKAACKSFLRIMASVGHPVVLFLDDVQWADQGSRLLLQMFMNDDEIENVMFILAYRDDEVANVVDILEHAEQYIDIALANLDAAAVHEMVCSILGTGSDDQLQDLSNLVEKRTQGHPLYVKMFLDIIKQEKLLSIDGGGLWIFDLDKIKSEIMVSETLADLLSRKIERLSAETKQTLKVASLLGYHFCGAVLENVANIATEEHQCDDDTEHSAAPIIIQRTVLLGLSEATKSGFIEATRDGYHFTHDKLQSSFRSLLSQGEEERLHLLIGEAYLDRVQQDESAAYHAAAHLNRAPAFLDESQQKRHELAQINLDGAKYCEKKMAFVNAAIMLRMSLKTLGSNDRWSEEHFDLTFEIMECLAKMQLLLADFDACRESIAEALLHAKTVEMKRNLLLLDVEVRGARYEIDDGVVTAKDSLAILGVEIPSKISCVRVVMKLLKVKLMLLGKTDEYLLSLPTTADLVTTTSVKLLMYLFSYSLSINAMQPAIYSALLAMELTLKKGLSPHSPFAFAIYGVAELKLGKLDRAYRFGKLALAILSRMNSQEAACPTVGFALTLLTFQREPMLKLVDPLMRVGGLGYRHGDILFGSYCLSSAFSMQNIMGANLEAAEKSMRETYNMVGNMGQAILLMWYQPYLQHTINMRSDERNWESMGILDGDIMKEDDFFRQVEEEKNPVLKTIVLRVKVQEAVFFHHFDRAVSLNKEMETSGGRQSSHRLANSYWLAARAHFELYQSIATRFHLRKGRKYTKLLERLDASGNPNIFPYLAFLRAEEISRRKNASDPIIRAAYHESINILAASDYVHLEGLLNESAGFVFVKRGHRADAESYFQRALDIYSNDWGSIAKYNWLSERSAVALSLMPDNSDTKNTPFLSGKLITVVPNELEPDGLVCDRRQADGLMCEVQQSDGVMLTVPTTNIRDWSESAETDIDNSSVVYPTSS